MRVLHENFGGRSGALVTYLYCFKALASQYPEDEYIIHCLPDAGFETLSDLPNVKIVYFKSGIGKQFRQALYAQRNITKTIAKYHPDLIWSTNLGPNVHTGIVQVLHVLNAFQWHEPSIIRFHPRHAFHVHAMRLLFRRSLRRCDAAVVETPWVAEGVRQIPLAPSRIVVIPKAVEDETDIQHKQIPQRMRGLFDGKLGRGAFTFLYVATNLPHKNIATLISAIEILRDRGEKIRLVLSVSEKDLRSIDSVQAADLVKCGYILPVGWVEKDFLRDLYDNSTACVMPSFLECLSSSYLEAMQWGKPQICSDMPFAHETCGSASVYADPNDPRDWADKMASLAHDPLLQSSLAEKGHWQIKQFPQSWSDVASRFHQLFEGLLSNRL